MKKMLFSQYKMLSIDEYLNLLLDLLLNTFCIKLLGGAQRFI